MKLSLPRAEFDAYVGRLLDTFVPDGSTHELTPAIDRALEWIDICFQHVALRGYRTDEGEAQLSHLHGDQFAQFLYCLSNVAFRDLGDVVLAQKVFLLNRARHGIIVMYDTQLPEIFLFVHPVGTMIGKGNYSNFTVFYQNVTIANDITEIPTVGQGVIFYPGSFLVSKGLIGEGAVLTAGTVVRYDEIPPNHIVSGTSPNLTMTPRKRDILGRFFLPPTPGSSTQ